MELAFPICAGYWKTRSASFCTPGTREACFGPLLDEVRDRQQSFLGCADMRVMALLLEPVVNSTVVSMPNVWPKTSRTSPLTVT